MVTALSLMRGAPSSAPLDQDDKVVSLARWLAHQRAVPIHLVESTALEIAGLTTDPGALEGDKAPLVIQPRGALWLVGKLGGRAILHIFPDLDTAIVRGRELATEEGVVLLTVGQGGEVSRWHEEVVPPSGPATPEDAAPPSSPAPAELPLEVRRHPSGWAVMLRGRVIATAPTREKARLRKKALAEDPDFRDVGPA